ncbi:MAG: DUF3160 domain-containing protein [Candidatus Marinimicrobia bacterium]|nr:DUF3160 domain-containing protein [Candidatus Neomarinimicrobiota bacterium]
MKVKLLSIMLISFKLSFAQTGMLAEITGQIETEFGTYIPYLVDIEPNAPQYVIESDFSNVSNFSDFTFTESQKQKLLENHFVVIPGRDSGLSGYKEIYDIYNEARESDIPQFITTDAVLHTYHNLFDKILSTSEEDYLIHYLKDMDSMLVHESLNAYHTHSDDFIRSCFKTLIAYFSVPLKLLDSTYQVPDLVSDTVRQELELIEAHEGYKISPLFGAYLEDYSQYKPRGHYTKTKELEKYFKAMMWHGRQTFVLHDSEGTPCIITGSALALIYLMENMVKSDEVWTLWNNIYLPTVFFVGKADDLLPQDYFRAALEYFGQNFASQNLADILNESVLTEFISWADEYFPDPEISTLTGKGMRFMGQRYVPDSYILDQLVSLQRPMPKSLDILAVLHSNEAYNLLEEMGETNYAGYLGQLAMLKAKFENYPDEQWVENLYWNWLYCLMPLLMEKDGGFPPFMQNLAWLRKDLNTALGSWTELRHNTLLYAKQSLTPIGDGPRNILVRGYVEPNPWLFARLVSLIKLTKEGLTGLSILNEDMEGRLIILEDLLLTLTSISEKELTGGEITTEEYITLCMFGQTIKDLVTFNEYNDEYNWYTHVINDEMPVIADVHTDPNTSTCLEEGVGYPFRIYVICPVEGELTVTVGGMFSYYEFVQPIANRLTDEEWIVMLTSETPPELPYWTEEYLDPEYDLTNSEPYVYYCDKKGLLISNIQEETLPGTFALHQNYPNPFNSSTSIQYDLPRDGFVNISIYDILGKHIITLKNSHEHAGYKIVYWNGYDYNNHAVPSGVYVCKIEYGKRKAIRKMMLVK